MQIDNRPKKLTICDSFDRQVNHSNLYEGVIAFES